MNKFAILLNTKDESAKIYKKIGHTCSEARLVNKVLAVDSCLSSDEINSLLKEEKCSIKTIQIEP
jgi:hypothetical protein